MDAIKNESDEAFKFFWLIFGTTGLGKNAVTARLYD